MVRQIETGPGVGVGIFPSPAARSPRSLRRVAGLKDLARIHRLMIGITDHPTAIQEQLSGIAAIGG